MIIKTNVKATFHNIETGEDVIIKKKNLVVNDGLASFAERAAGEDIPANKKGTITYCAVGTGTNVPAAGDSDLQTELARKQVADRDAVSGTATYRSFFATGEANGVLKEMGLFGDDATATPDSGTLFARVNIDKTKTSSETLTLEWDIIFASS